MEKSKFFVELKEEINLKDFSNLRLLYSPIIGHRAIMLFQIFFDYFNLNRYNNSFYQLSEISKIMNLKIVEIEKERIKLEAVGLLRTFEKADNISFLFRLNKPLSPESFRKNSFLFRHILSKIGELIFERIEFSQKTKKINKDEFRETTIKYQDLFDLQKEHEEISNTLEIVLPTDKSKKEAIASLTFSQYVYYLTSARISPSQLHIFQSLLNQGFSSRSLNLIIDYSFIRNNRIVANHVKKIAEDLLSKEIKDSHSVELELKMALANRTNKIKETPIFKEENKDEDIENWSDLFNSLGGF